MPGSKEVTLSFLGCGSLGLAILNGILTSLTEAKERGTSAVSEDGLEVIPTKFIACVRTTGKRVTEGVSKYASSFPVQVLENDNLTGTKNADVVILGCNPWFMSEILQAPGIREALKGKLLISILAGPTVEQIEEVLYPAGSATPPEERCRVVRAMPNAAAMVRESMTIIGTVSPPLPDQWAKLVSWIFTRIGQVVHLPPSNMDACTSLAGSGPGFAALVIEGLAEGGVAMGIPRPEAQLMATQVMRGTAAMVLDGGDPPALLREKICTPGGCTVGGLLLLEETAVRANLARAVREATVIASQLGQGVQNVNGTRF